MTPPPPDLSDKMKAGIELIRRSGAKEFQMRFSDDEKPIVWMVLAGYGDGRYEVDAAFDPERAALRLCERLVDGGRCAHCGRPTGLELDSLEVMPMNKMICWYQYDPELKKFRRACEGDT